MKWSKMFYFMFEVEDFNINGESNISIGEEAYATAVKLWTTKPGKYDQNLFSIYENLFHL